MPKAIAVQAVFLIAVIAISLFFIVAIFWGWIDTTKFGTGQATCTAKATSYCGDWARNKERPGWWATKEPIDCSREDIKITEPSCEECKQKIGYIKCP